jgi:hypothetical protein
VEFRSFKHILDDFSAAEKKFGVDVLQLKEKLEHGHFPKPVSGLTHGFEVLNFYHLRPLRHFFNGQLRELALRHYYRQITNSGFFHFRHDLVFEMVDVLDPILVRQFD